MALVDTANRLASAAVQLRGPTANLANTRALVVEPMLNELGWDTMNLEHVARDWPLGNDFSISYALRVRDNTVLFVEAVPIDSTATDESLVSWTLEHVARADTRWCLITNGLHYRLFKADDAVAPDNRLLFEFELSEVAADARSEAAESLGLLARESLIDGSLELRGEQFFIDPRVREALLDLCRDPSDAFITAMNEAVGAPTVPAERLRASLARTVDRRRGGIGGGVPAPRDRGIAAASVSSAAAETSEQLPAPANGENGANGDSSAEES